MENKYQQIHILEDIYAFPLFIMKPKHGKIVI